MTDSNKVFAMSIFVMGVVVFLTTAGSVSFLYHTAVEEQKERLLEVVKNRQDLLKLFMKRPASIKKTGISNPVRATPTSWKSFFQNYPDLTEPAGKKEKIVRF